MITTKDLIIMGKAVCQALRDEQNTKALQGPDNKARYAARGMAALALEQMYYAAPEKTKAQLREAAGQGSEAIAYLFKQCGWPE